MRRNLLIVQIISFCERDTNDPDFAHNPLAKNQQNKMCNGKGTWDVIKEHDDFRNSPVNVEDSALHPRIQILQAKKTKGDNRTQACGRPLVLVLDYSNSMRGVGLRCLTIGMR